MKNSTQYINQKMENRVIKNQLIEFMEIKCFNPIWQSKNFIKNKN